MRLLIVLNHHYKEIVDRVVGLYKPYFNDVVFAAPFYTDRGIRYSTGSYMWQGALVEYFNKFENDRQPTLVIHDDVAINLNKVDEIISLKNSSMGFTYRILGDIWCNHWNFRLCTNYFQSKSVLFGSGVDNVKNLLKNTQVYKTHKGFIDGNDQSILTCSGSDYPDIVKAYLEEYHKGKDKLEFGIPLWCGNSDILLIMGEDYTLFKEFLQTTIEIGMFVEHAIPTMYNWCGYGHSKFGDKLFFPFGEKYKSFDHFKSVSDIENYFLENNELFAIHPVKFSKFER